MNKYEIMYIIDPQTENVKEIQNSLHDILKRHGSITKITDWGIKELAYLINHKNKGHYTVLNVQTTDEDIKEFLQIAKNTNEVIRYFVLNIDNEQNYSEKMVDELDIKVFEKSAERRPRPGFDRRNRPAGPYNRENRDNREQTPRTYNRDHKNENK